MSILAVIPARQGSKGLAGKNHRLLCGKPLISWTIEQALACSVITDVVITTDDSEIQDIAHQYASCKVIKRKPELAKDNTPMIDVVLDAISNNTNYKYLALLQPTSPMRSSQDINHAFQTMKKSNSQSCVSVTPVLESPYWMYSIDGQQTLLPIIDQAAICRRQDLPNTYKLNGAIYIIEVDTLIKHRTFIDHNTTAYVMPPERSVDIDSLTDFERCEKLMLNAANTPTGAA